MAWPKATINYFKQLFFNSIKQVPCLHFYINKSREGTAIRPGSGLMVPKEEEVMAVVSVGGLTEA